MWNQGASENTYRCVFLLIFRIELTFCLANGNQRKVKARIGDSIKETADAFGISIPGKLTLFYKSFNEIISGFIFIV